MYKKSDIKHLLQNIKWSFYVAFIITTGFISSNAVATDAATANDVAVRSGQLYQPVASVVPGQAQVVIYYPQGDAVAEVYVDMEYHKTLLPGEFSIMCVAPGAHVIESYLNDSPLYSGKTNPTGKLTANGGETYFIQVNSGVKVNTAAIVTREEAEQKLANLENNPRILNRASGVQACQYDNVMKPVLLQEVVYFDFAKSNEQGITSKSKSVIDNVVDFISKAKSVDQIHLVGYTDAVGSLKYNQKLSEARALTIKQLLMSKGVAVPITGVVGMGISPFLGVCESKAACDMRKRRVEIVIRGTNN